jgi:diaminohydroxyphosphoribosylaminopyrimidine deaminase/5-amino-6-(5-phosphoribosylamino)uracil reductase
MNASEFDAQMIRRALRLAMTGRGHVEPNPMVGCVLARDGRVIGEGFHAAYGSAHAEPSALASCTESPAGATAYVTLEPCCHGNKKTPPCAPRLIESKIARVVFGCLDPNPDVNGGGVRMLRDAGIEVAGPVLEPEARQLIAPFLLAQQRQRPYVTAKWAQSADGMVAGAMGRRVQISGEVATSAIHALRARCDAIAVGTNTVLNDDPMLTVRHSTASPRKPLRVILSNTLKLAPTSKLARTARQHPTVVYCSERSLSLNVHTATMLRDAGVEIVAVPDRDGHFSMSDVLRDLHQRNVTHLLVEPGPTLLRSMVERNQIDRAWVIQSRLRIGEDGLAIRFAPRLDYLPTTEIPLGDDTLVELLNPQSDAYYAPVESADAVLTREIFSS